MKSAEIKILTKLWHRAIIKRDPICRMCHVKHSDEGHHIFKKRNMSVRFDLLNGLGMCRKCHNWAEDHPKESKKLIIYYLGKSRYELLKEKAGKIKVYQDFETIKEYLEGKL